MNLTIESNGLSDQAFNFRCCENLGFYPWSPKAPRNGKFNTALLNNQVNQTLCRRCPETPGKKIWTLGSVRGGLLRVGDQEWTAGLAHDLLTSMVTAWKEMRPLFSREPLHIFVLQMTWGSIRYPNGEEWRLATHVEPLISEESSFLVRRSHALVRNPNVLLRPINLNIFKNHRSIPSHARLISNENWEPMLSFALCCPIPVIVHLNPRKSALPPLWSIPLRLRLNLPLPAHDAILDLLSLNYVRNFDEVAFVTFGWAQARQKKLSLLLIFKDICFSLLYLAGGSCTSGSVISRESRISYLLSRQERSMTFWTSSLSTRNKSSLRLLWSHGRFFSLDQQRIADEVALKSAMRRSLVPSWVSRIDDLSDVAVLYSVAFFPLEVVASDVDNSHRPWNRPSTWSWGRWTCRSSCWLGLSRESSNLMKNLKGRRRAA